MKNERVTCGGFRQSLAVSNRVLVNRGNPAETWLFLKGSGGHHHDLGDSQEIPAESGRNSRNLVAEKTADSDGKGGGIGARNPAEHAGGAVAAHRWGGGDGPRWAALAQNGGSARRRCGVRGIPFVAAPANHHPEEFVCPLAHACFIVDCLLHQ